MTQEELKAALKTVRKLIENDQLLIWGDTQEGISVCMGANDILDMTCLNGPAIQICLNPKKNIIKIIKR